MDKETIEGEIKRLTALKDVQHLEGVQALAAHTRGVIIATVGTLSNNYTEATEVQLRGLCATLRANVELHRLVTNADSDIAALEDALNNL